MSWDGKRKALPSQGWSPSTNNSLHKEASYIRQQGKPDRITFSSTGYGEELEGIPVLERPGKYVVKAVLSCLVTAVAESRASCTEDTWVGRHISV